MDNSKACTCCGQTKDKNLFYKNVRSKDGLMTRCKDCDRDMARSYRLRNRAKVNAGQRDWTARNPDKSAAKSKRWRSKNQPQQSAKPARKKYANRQDYLAAQKVASKIWEKNNRERSNKRKREWAKNNPDKVSAKDAQRRQRFRSAKIYNVSKKEIKMLLSKPCFYCNTTDALMTLDHVIPIALGGLHSIGNLVTACKSCNSSKGSKTIMQWKKVRALE